MITDSDGKKISAEHFAKSLIADYISRLVDEWPDLVAFGTIDANLTKSEASQVESQLVKQSLRVDKLFGF